MSQRRKVKMQGKKGAKVRRKFNKSVNKTKAANLPRTVMRGGIRF